MAKKLKTEIKLQVKAGEANPSPPIGPALGQHGLNIMDFCKAFNERSSKHEKGLVLPVVISVYEDRSFDFIINAAQVKEIAEVKMPDLSAGTIETAMRSVAGTARSMGVDVEPLFEDKAD